MCDRRNVCTAAIVNVCKAFELLGNFRLKIGKNWGIMELVGQIDLFKNDCGKFKCRLPLVLVSQRCDRGWVFFGFNSVKVAMLYFICIKSIEKNAIMKLRVCKDISNVNITLFTFNRISCLYDVSFQFGQNRYYLPWPWRKLSQGHFSSIASECVVAWIVGCTNITNGFFWRLCLVGTVQKHPFKRSIQHLLLTPNLKE